MRPRAMRPRELRARPMRVWAMRVWAMWVFAARLLASRTLAAPVFATWVLMVEARPSPASMQALLSLLKAHASRWHLAATLRLVCRGMLGWLGLRLRVLMGTLAVLMTASIAW
eukprot:5473157-Pleurochrysis_carterae.AAC.1